MENIAWTMNCHSSQRCKFTLKANARTPQTKSTWNSNECAYAKTTDCYRVLMLSVVSSNVYSIKLHFTAQNFGTDNCNCLAQGNHLTLSHPIQVQLYFFRAQFRHCASSMPNLIAITNLGWTIAQQKHNSD